MQHAVHWELCNIQKIPTVRCANNSDWNAMILYIVFHFKKDRLPDWRTFHCSVQIYSCNRNIGNNWFDSYRKAFCITCIGCSVQPTIRNGIFQLSMVFLSIAERNCRACDLKCDMYRYAFSDIVYFLFGVAICSGHHIAWENNAQRCSVQFF